MSETQAAARDIPTRRVVLNDASQLPHDYSTTPGGTLFSTTPGGNTSFHQLKSSLLLLKTYLERAVMGCHGWNMDRQLGIASSS